MENAGLSRKCGFQAGPLGKKPGIIPGFLPWRLRKRETSYKLMVLPVAIDCITASNEAMVFTISSVVIG